MHRHDCTFLLHVDFDAQARRTPDAVALQFRDSSITFSELRQRSDLLAGALRRRGIGDGSFVGLHVERSINYFIGLLAILKTNSAVVPLPPAYPRSRVHEILSFAALQAVIDDEDTPLDQVANTRVLHFAELAGERGDVATIASGSPLQPAFVLCSSGSTGKPKMIVRSHRSFYHRLCWTWENHPYETGERCCQKSSMTTTHALYELFEPMLRGVSVLIMADEEARDLEGFWKTINTRGISRLLIVPSALQVSMDLPGFAAPGIKVMVLMGEYVHHKVAGRALEAFPGTAHVYSIYGSTEASSTLVCDLRSLYRPNQELPLGKPISPDVRAYVLGSDFVPVAAGETGVLHIAGTALFGEYFRDPALTASVFVASPVAEGHLYDTHDQVRLQPDGNLHFVGRTDHTVKVRGYRVDLQEVERTLLLHPAVRQAAVMLGSGDAASAALFGFFTPETVDSSDVYRFLREHLPSYMIPSALVGLSSLPRTSSGKTDRRRLLEDYANRASTGAKDAEQSATEVKVCEIWRLLLRHGNIQSDSSFFEVGGTSLTAFAAVQRLRDAFELERNQLSDQAIYQFPTVREIAACIDGLKSGAAPMMPAGTTVLVRLSKGSDATLPPFFLIASAGGTLGAYEKLAKALRTKRDIVGVRDPYIWGERDPTLGYQSWVTLYINAIRQRQPRGPYHLGAYSSAGAFGYEIARRLRQDGDEVAVLVLIDPYGLDRPSPRSFGYRVTQARFRGRLYRMAVRMAGWWRAVILRMRRDGGPYRHEIDVSVTTGELAKRIHDSKRSKGDVVGFSVLLELNTGLPFGVTDAELSPLDPDQYFPAFLARVKQSAPEIDLEVVERIYGQYYGLQVPAQQGYRLHRYDGNVLLFELDGPSRGLVAAQLRPHVRNLRSVGLNLGGQSERIQALFRTFSAGMRDHYVSMRDDEFVRKLAVELDTVLR